MLGAPPFLQTTRVVITSSSKLTTSASANNKITTEAPGTPPTESSTSGVQPSTAGFVMPPAGELILTYLLAWLAGIDYFH